jgi:hypothetical protein
MIGVIEDRRKAALFVERGKRNLDLFCLPFRQLLRVVPDIKGVTS